MWGTCGHTGFASVLVVCGSTKSTEFETQRAQYPTTVAKFISSRGVRRAPALDPNRTRMPGLLHTAGPAGIDACGGGCGPRHDRVRLAEFARSAVVSPSIPRLQPWGSGQCGGDPGYGSVPFEVSGAWEHSDVYNLGLSLPLPQQDRCRHQRPILTVMTLGVGMVYAEPL
jgi:hypothetical protein